eukprot:11912225-Alexandrium_andersonii.AAC.1
MPPYMIARERVGRRSTRCTNRRRAAGEAVVAAAGRLAVWTCIRVLHICTRARMVPSLARIQARLWPVVNTS